MNSLRFVPYFLWYFTSFARINIFFLLPGCFLQVFGGAGFNTDYPVEKLFRDAKIYQVSYCIELVEMFFCRAFRSVHDKFMKLFDVIAL